MDTIKTVLQHPSALFQGERVCVVTGSEKGIGYAVVKGLLKEYPNWVVYVTSPDELSGQSAVQRLRDEEKMTARFHQLDIDDVSSIRRFRDHIKENHKNGIHLLVNNAGNYPDIRAEGRSTTGGIPTAPSHPASQQGVSSTTGPTQPLTSRVEPEVLQAGKEIRGEQPIGRPSERPEERDISQRTESMKLGESEKSSSRREEVKFRFNRDAFRSVIQNNYFSTLNVCRELFPLLGDNSTVIFVGSRLSNLCFMQTKEDKQMQLRGCTRVDDVSKLMEELMNADPDQLFNPEDEKDTKAWLAKSPDFEIIPNYQLGALYPWAMAKLGLSIICRLYQLQFDSEKQTQNVHIVTCCPGMVKTDMFPEAVRTPEQGADTIIWCALQPKDTDIRGVVCADRKKLDPFVLPEGQLIFQ